MVGAVKPVARISPTRLIVPAARIASRTTDLLLTWGLLAAGPLTASLPGAVRSADQSIQVSRWHRIVAEARVAGSLTRSDAVTVRVGPILAVLLFSFCKNPT
ncbi:hypothetical protein TPA0907_14530 [Micromonospora humidisoli]|nr:hypothetical protein TPA0907_14530 [Micromonospora sp. AKA109]